ncbi:NADH oxidase [Xylariaceae sp. FL0016]|nr:NADH oxidase [Xylariaceae sp. FL0016]
MPARYPALAVDPSPLGQPLQFQYSSVIAPNRFMKAAMTERLATWDGSATSPTSGIPDAALFNLYKQWGAGGWGMVVTGNILVDPRHIEAPGNMILPVDAPLSGPRFAGYQRLAQAGKEGGSLFVAQLNHPGRQISAAIQTDPVSASDVQLAKPYAGMKFAKPHAATLDEIEEIQRAFVRASTYLQSAGFDGIQIHGAHGYLIAQFISPKTNRRADAYGGGIANRARFAMELGDAIRAATGPDFLIGIKVNSVEFEDSGFSTTEAAVLVELLEKHGYDFVELTGGTYEAPGWHHQRESTKKREAFFLDFAELLVPHMNSLRCYLTGGLLTTRAMVDVLESGIDGVGLARPSGSEPDLPRLLLHDITTTKSVEEASGKTYSCLKPVQLYGEDEGIGIRAVIAGAQMRLMSLGFKAFDPSVEENFSGFMRDYQYWMDSMKQRKEEDPMGHIDLMSIKATPYEGKVAEPLR